MAAHTESISLYAAGSLKAALTEVAKAYEAQTGSKVVGKFGPSGLLKDALLAGAEADVFASANMAHPQALADAGMCGPVKLFARNRLCALVRPGLAVTGATLLDRMLDPQVKLGTSTPKADPSGDYAFAVFHLAEAVKSGAQATLERKALLLTGGEHSVMPAEGRNVYGWHVAEGRADIFLTYSTNAIAARRDDPRQQIIDLPATLAVGADYGLTVMTRARPAALAFADYVLSAPGQTLLMSHGFASKDAT